MTTDSPDFRLDIRQCVSPSNPYMWEIYSVSEHKRIKRSSNTYPTRGAAMKAGRKALLRIIAPSLGADATDHSEHSQATKCAPADRHSEAAKFSQPG
jgi:hypothetical protein